ncbi:MAG: TonB family protein [Thermoanaerobaculia bacterium]
MKRAPAVAAVLAVFAAAAAAPLHAAGKPSLNVYFQKTLTDTAYQKKVFDKVARLWRTPASLPAVGKKTVVQAVITKDGKLASAMVTMESGSKAWDDAALAAVRGAAPFEPLPKGYAFPSVEVHFHVALTP